MKNPLIKRLPREFKNDLAKYVILFVFLTAVIGFVSGFLAASNSMMSSYNESFEKYNVEDGNFELALPASNELLNTLAKGNYQIHENFYIELDTKNYDSTLRIFRNRKEVNLPCLMEGTLPQSQDEIAIDRMYAANNTLSIGDTITVSDKELTICGLVALSDYSSLFQTNSEMIFDATLFGVGLVTEETFASFDKNFVHHSYSWQYQNTPFDDKEAKKMSEEFLSLLTTSITQNAITNFLPQYSNQAIQFVGDDMGKDSLMFTYFLYIVIAIIAFIFAITTSNTIATEASVIGTLRASGYTKGELIRHYMSMPLLVTFVSALLGNIMGYSFFKNLAVNIYYQSYSLPTYVTLWNADAFLKTTVIPVILMIAINYVILTDKLSLSPLQFLRRDLSKKQKKKAIRLNEKSGIMHRFRTRVILQNIPNYITIIVGVFFANVILLFGMAMPALLDKYQEEIQNNMICAYQYVLKAPYETTNTTAEKYASTSLNTLEGKLKSEVVTLMGIQADSKYVDIDLTENGVYISNALSEKFNIKIDDNFILKDDFEDKEYTFKVKGVYYYPAGITVFMTHDAFRRTFSLKEDYFNGYFSNQKLTDVPETCIATTITEEDLTKTSRQMDVSLGSVMDMFSIFGIIMFMLIIFLLSKIVIEKNAQSISMTKILGYNDKEISKLYITSTTLVVIASLILTLPLVDFILSYVIVVIMSEYAGYLPYYVPFSTYLKIIAVGIISYSIIAIIQFRKVKRIPLDMVLKNRE